jgi:hypothetical protein
MWDMLHCAMPKIVHLNVQQHHYCHVVYVIWTLQRPGLCWSANWNWPRLGLPIKDKNQTSLSYNLPLEKLRTPWSPRSTAYTFYLSYWLSSSWRLSCMTVSSLISLCLKMQTSLACESFSRSTVAYLIVTIVNFVMLVGHELVKIPQHLRVSLGSR